MNSDYLKSVIRKNHETQRDLAKSLGISLSCLNDKINGKNTSFRQSEILAIKCRYNLSSEEVDSIFFTAELS